MKFICREAYIETGNNESVKNSDSKVLNSIPFKFTFLAAIRGYPFFTAGKVAVSRLSANALRVFVINSIGDFVLFLGKASVVVLTVIAGIQMIKTKESVHHMWVLLVLGGIFAYLIAHTFISVFEVCFSSQIKTFRINLKYFVWIIFWRR